MPGMARRWPPPPFPAWPGRRSGFHAGVTESRDERSGNTPRGRSHPITGLVGRLLLLAGLGKGRSGGGFLVLGRLRVPQNLRGLRSNLRARLAGVPRHKAPRFQKRGWEQPEVPTPYTIVGRWPRILTNSPRSPCPRVSCSIMGILRPSPPHHASIGSILRPFAPAPPHHTASVLFASAQHTLALAARRAIPTRPRGSHPPGRALLSHVPLGPF